MIHHDADITVVRCSFNCGAYQAVIVCTSRSSAWRHSCLIAPQLSRRKCLCMYTYINTHTPVYIYTHHVHNNFTTTAWAVRARAGRPEIRSVLAGARCEHMLTENDLQELGTVPVLLVWGEHERVFSEADLTWFTQHLNAEHTTVVRPAGCGHIPFLD
eukprot:13977-Heterococcus_DN1.PRE.2